MAGQREAPPKILKHRLHRWRCGRPHIDRPRTDPVL